MSSPGHRRSYECEAVIFDPQHYLALLEQKTRALDQAAPLAGWQLREFFNCGGLLAAAGPARLSPGDETRRTVIPPLESFQLQLQAQHLHP
jgi:hypothetical protein